MIVRELKLNNNRKLRRAIDGYFWHLTGVYNWAIKTIEFKKGAGLGYSAFDLINMTRFHSKKCEVPKHAINGTIFQAFGAWENCWNKQSKKPKLKGNRNRLNSFQFMGDCKIREADSRIRLPNLGWVKYQRHTNGLPEGKIASTVRIIKKPSGLYAVILFKDAEHKQVALVSNTKVGIDTGFKNLITLSNGKKYPKYTELSESENQLAKNQRGDSKKKTARLHEKIQRQRRDRNHKISHDLIKEHQEIYITNDNLQGVSGLFGKSVQSSGIAQLRQFLIYKGRSVGRKVELVESKNTTKTCSGCGALTGPTGLNKLNVRNWVCVSCGANHDRDINASINILKAGEGYSLDLLKKTG